MRKKFTLLFTLGVLVFALVFLPQGSVLAQYADGTYDVHFELKEAGNDNTSIADGYFSKPAKLVVENGKNFVQLTITSSEWVKALSGPAGEATVISEDKNNNTRTVKLQVGDLSKPVELQMHVVVPEEIAGMPYDHNHTVRAVFDVSNIPESGGEDPESSDQGSSQQSASDDVVENPQTSDDSPIGLYVILLLSSIAVFTFYKLRLAKN